jgi:hypothetical protein
MRRNLGRTLIVALVLVLLTGCVTSKSKIMESGSQVEIRSYQTKSYDQKSKNLAMRSVMATLQDLGFVIDKADDVIGVVSATKLDGYALQMTVTVRDRGSKVEVRANAQYNLTVIEDPEPYQNFFASLDKSIFLEENL